MTYSRRQVIDTLRRAGFTDAAAGAETELPDEMDVDTLQTWAEKHGITKDAIVSQMGGSS